MLHPAKVLRKKVVVMIYLLSILVYLFILTGIGIYKSRQVKNQADFAVAGRSLSPWVMVCTMLAVWIGTGSIVGNAEKTFFTGSRRRRRWTTEAFDDSNNVAFGCRLNG